MAEYVGQSTTVWAIVGASESVFLGVLCLVLHIQQHQVCVPNAEKLFLGVHRAGQATTRGAAVHGTFFKQSGRVLF